jgi:hypothetical protein
MACASYGPAHGNGRSHVLRPLVSTEPGSSAPAFTVRTTTSGVARTCSVWTVTSEPPAVTEMVSDCPESRSRLTVMVPPRTV